MVEGWYSEIENYDFKRGKSNNGRCIGHFAQVIWKSTTKVGMARSTCGCYVFANYLATGNVEGQYLTNVLPIPADVFPPKLQEDELEEQAKHYIRVGPSASWMERYCIAAENHINKALRDFVPKQHKAPGKRKPAGPVAQQVPALRAARSCGQKRTPAKRKPAQCQHVAVVERKRQAPKAACAGQKRRAPAGKRGRSD